MLTSIYIDNYKTFSDFTMDFNRVHLLVGPNGSGKSAILEVLRDIRSFAVLGYSTKAAFSPSSLTKWIDGLNRTFALNVKIEDTDYHYTLKIHHDHEKRIPILDEETLSGNGNLLMSHIKDKVSLNTDDGSSGLEFLVERSNTALHLVQERIEYNKIRVFNEWMQGLILLQLNPFSTQGETSDENEFMDYYGSNFASWYRHHSQENPSEIPSLLRFMQYIIPGCTGINLTKTGEKSRKISINIEKGDRDKPYILDFDEMSLGQKTLFAFYALKCFGIKKGSTVILDEPDNFVALRELQPLINDLFDAAYDEDGQVIVVSHNTEVINAAGLGSITYLDRTNGSFSKIVELGKSDDDSPFTPAELVVLGV